jgi:hypothetical protein
MNVATVFWLKTTPGDDRPWLAPDIRIAQTSKDFLTGRDPVLEAVLSRWPCRSCPQRRSTDAESER